MKKIIFATFLLISNWSISQCFISKGIGGKYDDKATSIVVDNNGNTFITGTFRGFAVDFDPGAAVFNLTSGTSGGHNSAFLCKFDINGNFLWAIKFLDQYTPTDMIIVETGNIIISAASGFQSSPGTGRIIKFDNNGNIIWNSFIGGYPKSIVRQTGYIWVTGSFQGTKDFDPSPSTAVNKTAVGGNDIFMLMLGINTGAYTNVFCIGGLGNDDGMSIFRDNSISNIDGNIYITGSFSFTFDFNYVPLNSQVKNLTSNGMSDIFIMKISHNNNKFLWAISMGGTQNDIGQDISVDNSGNIYSIGSFQNTVDFNPGTGITNITSVGSTDIYINKVDANGNLIWVKKSGSSTNDEGLSIINDNSGNIYSTGYYSGIADFDPNASTYNLISSGSSLDIFLWKLDNNGNLIWVNSYGGTGEDKGLCVTTDNTGSPYNVGYFSSIADFDPRVSVLNLTSNGAKDIYFQVSSGTIPTITASGATSICPGESVTLTSSSTTGNIWSNGSTSKSITVNTAGSYSVSNSSGTCSVSSAPITITLLNAPPVPTISSSSSTTFCSGGSVTLTSSSSSGNLWSNGSTNQSITVNSSGTYNVTVSNGTCSTSSSPIQVNVLSYPPNPVVSANGPTSFCPGESVILTSNSNIGNVWSTGETTNSINVSTPGSYTVANSNGNCTSYSNPITVSFLNAPATPTITSSVATSICLGDSVILTSSSTIGNLWNTGETTQSIVVTSNGIFNLSVSNGICTSTPDSIEINVLQYPTVPTITANGSTTFCPGGNVTLTSSALSGNNWNTGEISQSINVTADGIYYVSLSNGNCVSNSDTIFVTLLNAPAVPTIDVTGGISLCQGDSAVLTSSSLANNLWSNGESTQSIAVNTDGNYSVTVSNGNCSSTSNPVTITVNPLPIINSNPTDIQVNIGNQATFTTASNAKNYQWQVNSGAGFQNITNGGQYSGSTTNTLTVLNTTMSNDNNFFRCTASSNNCNVLTNEAKLTVINNSGLSENTNLKGLSIYPNPTANIITITSSSDYIGKNFVITDNSGRIVMNGTITSENTNVNLEGLSPGLYNLDLGIGFSGKLKLVKQ
jgi:hypothetical protein